MTPCGDMQQSFTDALAKWFFNNFPMFADSFGLVSIQCTLPRELAANILYKCSAPHSSSLRQRQHGLLVAQLMAVSSGMPGHDLFPKIGPSHGAIWAPTNT